MSVANLSGPFVLAVLTHRRIHGIDAMRVLSTYLRCTMAAVLAGVLGGLRLPPPISSPARDTAARSWPCSSAGPSCSSSTSPGCALLRVPRARDLVGPAAAGSCASDRRPSIMG
jgi:hypothetical protein